ncbi:tyrosine recombinase XerC [bacterium MnTg02]|nr:tyrosine recombinase XerC [bacterium MnTg02]
MGFRTAKITTDLIERLKPGETVSDIGLPGFMVRRQKGKAFIYFVRKFVRGTRHYVTIGEHGVEGWTENRARQEALLILASLRRGYDPAAERMKARGMPTLAAFADSFLEGHGLSLKPKTLKDYRWLLKNHIAPKTQDGILKPGCLGRLKLDQVNRTAVAALHKKLRNKPRTANYMLAFLSSLFSEAQLSGLLSEETANPARKIKRYPERHRQRFLTEAELDRVGEAMSSAEADGSEDPYALAAIRLLILTGARLKEILTLRWEDVDFERMCLYLPDHKTTTTTLAPSKVIHLSPPALDVLSHLPRVDGNPYVIVGAKANSHWVNLQKPWVRIRQAAQLTTKTLPDGKIENVRLHDLRHSYASIVASGGATLVMIGKLLGHTQPLTTLRYAHLVDDPLKRVNDKAGYRVAAALWPLRH